MRHDIKTMQTPDGLRLEYVEHGDHAGTALVLLHGYTDSWRSFEGVLSRLPARLHAVALSQRGHGGSDRPRTGYRPEDFAADVAALLTGLGIDRAVVLGHSMGATVAQRLAIDYPDRVLGLVLAGGRADWRTHPGVIDLHDHVRSMRDPVDAGFVADFQRSTITRPVADGLLEMVVAESLKLPARVWRAACEECVLAPDLTPELAGVHVPTLLLCGDGDDYARDAQRGLADAIVGARLEVYRDTGHALHWEQPERFATDLVAFVDEVVRRAVTSPARTRPARRRSA